MKTLILVPGSGINCDYLDAHIFVDNKEIYEHRYAYGYNISYDRCFETEEKPYVTDVVKKIVEDEKIDEIEIGRGTYVFSTQRMSESDAENCALDYLKEDEELSKKYKGVSTKAFTLFGKYAGHNIGEK